MRPVASEAAPDGVAVVTIPPLAGPVGPQLHALLALALLATTVRARGLAASLRITAVTPEDATGGREFGVDLMRDRTFLGLLEDLASGGDPAEPGALTVDYTVGAAPPTASDAALSLHVTAGTTGFVCTLRANPQRPDTDWAESLVAGMTMVSDAIATTPERRLSDLASGVEAQTAAPPATDEDMAAFGDPNPDDEPAGPARERPEMEEPYVAPRTELEHRVAGIWQRALSVDQVGIHDDFFELGGHSLIAAAVVLQLQEALHIDFPARTLYLQPTVAGLAEAIASAGSSPDGDRA